MSNQWIDISMPIHGQMPVWPGNNKPDLVSTSHNHDGAVVTSTNLTTNLHSGTHIDAPLHFIAGGAPMSGVDLDSLMGPAHVVDLTGCAVVTADVLNERVPAGVERLLMKTDNSTKLIYEAGDFDETFVGLDLSGAQWIAQRNLRAVGNDYLSIARYKGEASIHTDLMHANVTIIEGLVLHHVEPGPYVLMCLPLSVPGTEAALARALLRRS